MTKNNTGATIRLKSLLFLDVMSYQTFFFRPIVVLDELSIRKMGLDEMSCTRLYTPCLFLMWYKV